MNYKVIVLGILVLLSITQPSFGSSYSGAIAGAVASTSRNLHKKDCGQVEVLACPESELPLNLNCDKLIKREPCIYDCYMDTGVRVFIWNEYSNNFNEEFLTYENVDKRAGYFIWMNKVVFFVTLLVMVFGTYKLNKILGD